MNEIRDGFLVTEGRKRLWEVELELIDFVDKVCVKNKLNYFLIGGAAIGAVRHGGFIPWDDDMDIGLLRADFEKFVQIFKAMEHPNYIMEYGYKGDETTGTFLRIRDKRTTAIIRQQYHANKEHGVFIELYPFDGVPSDEKKRNKQISSSARLKAELDYRFDKRSLGKRGKLLHRYYSLFSTKKIWNKWQTVCTRYNGQKTGMVDTPALPGYAKQRIHLYHIEDVQESEYVDYDGHKVRVAKGNDRCLKIHFGDYMKLPPVEERGMKHSVIVFYDAFTPWQEYMEKKKDVVDRFFDGEYKLSNIW